ncbi:MAG: hypothetical protein J6O13_15625 [Selenomonas sp.]|nr:hypothetical protein [Selenomonas sp.]
MKKFDANAQGTYEQMKKAMVCESAEELLQLAAEEGYDMTKEEAEKYFDQLSEIDLSPEDLEKVAGGAPIPGLEIRNGRRW